MTLLGTVTISSPKAVDILQIVDSVRLCVPINFSERDGAVAHATGSAQCREECCERGYYNLHRQLDESFLFHNLRIYLSKDLFV